MAGGHGEVAADALACEGLTVGYRGRTSPVLDRLSLRFAPARLTALVGPNACGKSTLLKTMLGLLHPSAGRVTLGGDDVRDIRPRDLARRLAYLPQESHCPDYLSVAELVSLGGYARQSVFAGPSARDREVFSRALATVGLEGLGREPVNRLSGGQRQRAWLAMALAQDAPILVLDEPVNHLDLKYQYAVLDIVRDLVTSQRRTVIAVLHDLNLAAAYADEVVMLDAGRLHASGPVRRALTAANIEHVFGLAMDVFDRDGRWVCLPAGAPRA